MIATDTTPIHEQIYTYLFNKGMKLSWVAKQINISQPYLHLILTGHRNLSPSILEKLNQILGTDFKEQ